MNKERIEDYREALLSITALAQDGIEPQEAIAVGIQFFAKMAFDMAPNEETANEVISLGISFALEDSRSEK